MAIDTTEQLVKPSNTIAWGKKNDFAYKIIELFNGSAIHQGIIRSKVSYINSNGFEIVSGNQEEIQSFIDNGISDYSINDVLDACVLDLELLGGFAIKGSWNREGTRPAWLEHVDIDALRPNEDETKYYYSIDWTKSKQDDKTNYKEYDVLDLNNREGEFIIYFKTPTKKNKGEQGYFPKPDYIAGLKSIETDVEISKFHLSEILNVFSAGTIINDPSGVPETEEQIKGARDKKDVLTGSENAGKVILNFSNGKENEITVTHLNGNDLHNRYEMTEKTVQNNILYAHAVTSGQLVGIKTSGQLGGADELRNSFNIWNKTYISRKQKFINNAFNWILNLVYDIEGEIKLEEADINSIIETPDVAPTNVFKEKFASDIAEVIGLFSKVGKPISECKITLTGAIEGGKTSSEAELIASEFIRQEFDTIAGVKVESLQANILKLIGDGVNLTTIANETNTPLFRVVENAEQLRSKGLLNDNLQITQRGRLFIQNSNLEMKDFEVRFTYEKRDDVEGATVIPTTRDFCRELIALGRAFTRAEIDTISARVGRDVFAERGGWYHNPKTNQNTPYCRHIWKFNLVQK